MNLNVGGIMKKLEQNADWVAALISVYQRFDGNLDQVWQQYTSTRVMNEIQNTLTHPWLIKHKLLESDHLYTGLFKAGIGAYIASELGIIPSKYKNIAKKIMWGSGVAAITLPGSGESHSHGSSGGSGGNPFEGVYG